MLVTESSAQKRRWGSDNPYLSWSPISGRSPFTWPNGAKLAVGFVVSIEHLEFSPPEGARPTPSSIDYGPYPRAFQLSRVADAEYGSRVGAFRLLKAFDENRIRPMVAMDAGLFADRPRLVQEFLDRDAEFLGHGISLSRAIGEETEPNAERSGIALCLDVVEEATKQRPLGWLSPEYGESTRTLEILSSLGVRYVCDWANDEQPYRLHVDGGEMTALPVAVDLDDVMVGKVRRLPAWRWSKLVTDALRQLLRDGSRHGRLLILNLHAHVSGQPYRFKYVREVLATVAQLDDVWLATGSEICNWYADTAGRPS
jgi:allantoinase